MPKATFTARWVQSVPPPATGQVDYFDGKPPSLGAAPDAAGAQDVVHHVSQRRPSSAPDLRYLPSAQSRGCPPAGMTARHTVAQGGDPATKKQDIRTAPTVNEVSTQ